MGIHSLLNFYEKRRKSRLWKLSCFALLLIVGLGSGCGGFSASKSVSPLDFFLPGILKVDPPEPPVPEATNTLVCLRN